MNWLIWEKMFTYFYSKFRPVNCMYYIKCGVNSSLLTEFLLLHKVCGTLDHCFIMTQYSQRGWYITNLLLCDIPRNKAPCRGPPHIWRTVPFLWSWEKHRWQSSWVDFAGHCLWLLLLRLAAAVPLLVLPQNSLLTLLAFAPDSEAVWATRIFLMDSFSSFINFFAVIFNTHNCLTCSGYRVWLGTVSET